MMTFQGMLGVFILLAISVVVGFLIMIIEWIYASAKDAGKDKQVSATTRNIALLLHDYGPFIHAIFGAFLGALFNAIFVAPEFAMKIASVN